MVKIDGRSRLEVLRGCGNPGAQRLHLGELLPPSRRHAVSLSLRRLQEVDSVRGWTTVGWWAATGAPFDAYGRTPIPARCDILAPGSGGMLFARSLGQEALKVK